MMLSSNTFKKITILKSMESTWISQNMSDIGSYSNAATIDANNEVLKTTKCSTLIIIKFRSVNNFKTAYKLIPDFALKMNKFSSVIFLMIEIKMQLYNSHQESH